MMVMHSWKSCAFRLELSELLGLGLKYINAFTSSYLFLNRSNIHPLMVMHSYVDVQARAERAAGFRPEHFHAFIMLYLYCAIKYLLSSKKIYIYCNKYVLNSLFCMSRFAILP